MTTFPNMITQLLEMLRVKENQRFPSMKEKQEKKNSTEK